MRATQYLLATLQKTSKNSEITSHQLMLQSGMIRQVSSGLYTWLPTGLRVLRKLENIIREEMNKTGFIEIFMPIVQPATLWKHSGRWLDYGVELLRFKNRNNQEFILSPTHEEMISHLINNEIIPMKQFPINMYQIHTKYRDEARPRFGMIRSREFIMKDGYSFHTNQISLQNTYDNVYNAYYTIFNRLQLKFCTIEADPGKMGGVLSHEFQAYSKNGENKIEISVINSNQLNNFNCEIHNTKVHSNIKSPLSNKTMQLDNTCCISKLPKPFNISLYKTIKIIIVRANEKYIYNSPNLLGLVLQQDHQINCKKLLLIPEIQHPLSILQPEEAYKIIGIKPTLLNINNLSIPLIIDYHVARKHNFLLKLNKNKKYYFEINTNQNLSFLKIADLCGSNSDEHKHFNTNQLSTKNSVEVGHIFQLGNKYLNNVHNNTYQNNKRNYIITMGCYGIGVSRIIPIIIEQNHDKSGIIWPDEIAPFKLAIIPINMYNSINVKNIAEKLYIQFTSIGLDVFFDDRTESPGVIFYDIDLIGVPHILIISDRNLINKEVEYKQRKTGLIKKIKLDIVVQFFTKKLMSINT